MLSERERRVLARIEAHLKETDPDLVRMFHEGPPRSTAHGLPRTLLVFGLVLVVLGAVVAAVPVALIGMTLTLLALWVASTRSAGPGRPRLASPARPTARSVSRGRGRRSGCSAAGARR